MPGLDNLNIEQNTWHLSKRGLQPIRWIQDPSTNAQGILDHPDDHYAQLLMLPSDGRAFNEGDYVRIIGVLVEDSAHLHFPNGIPQDLSDWRHLCWDRVNKGNAGWLEIHPFDVMQKARPPSVRKHLQMVQLCSFQDGSGPLPHEVNSYLSPMDATPPTPNSVLRFEELVDPRFSDMSKVSRHTVEISPCDPTKLHVSVKIAVGGHFLAAYKLWWEESSQPRPAAIPCSVNPDTNPKPEEESPCTKKPYLPQCDPIKEDD